ncbi:MAG TPA: hypothetical protein VEC01_06490 [Noviherbaspirillum sp.]|uniref:hypothetical protein n=1 Tax=Noviherbaspirillum sp. TaxID=1926288 RepID=UPI002D612AD4|nr:hypothetical protein [Noviherbaspirillum sp.]HYD94955.1 hypothetical protein [Noviherbaspirillum sp.]
MSAIFPKTPTLSSAETDAAPVCEWVMPVDLLRRVYAKTCAALPPGMPDCLEVSVTHFRDGTERCTAAIYGERVYLVHYAFTPDRRKGD